MSQGSGSPDSLSPAAHVSKANIPKGTKLKPGAFLTVFCTGEENETDGKGDTKWCDNNQPPHYVVYDFGKPTTVSRWYLLNAACETPEFITRDCLLQGRNNQNEEWQTLDRISGNIDNIVDRTFNPVTLRYLRLFVTQPTQDDNGATRIYEFGVY